MSRMDGSGKPFTLFLRPGALQEENVWEADAIAQQEVTMAQARSESGGRDVIKFKASFGERPLGLLRDGSGE